MNILHVMWSMKIGGAERAVYQLIKAQREAGNKTDIVIANESGYYGKLCNETGAAVYSLNMKKSFDLTVRKNFLKIITEYDIVHFHSAEPLLMYFSAKAKNIKKYYTHRGGFVHYSFVRKTRYKITGYIIKKYFNGVSGNTKSAKMAASKLFNIESDKINVTYNGINFNLLMSKRTESEIKSELGIRDNKSIIIGVSANIRKWKRIDKLIFTLSNIEKNKYLLIVVGDGPEIKNLKRLTKELGLEKNIIFTGKKEYVSDYLQIFDIFVLPSNSLESFGNSAVEAMFFEIPTIIMKDGGGLTEHIIHNKTGYIANDFDDLKTLLLRIITSKEERENIGKEGRKYVMDNYSLDNMLSSYSTLYSAKV